MTCTAAVSLTLPLRDAGSSEADRPRNVATTELPSNTLSATDAPEGPPPAPGQPVAPAEGAPPLPTDQGETAAQPPAEPVTFAKVKVAQPRLRVTGVPNAKAEKSIRRVKGVRYASSFSVGRIPVGVRSTPVTVAAVNAQKFRKLTPDVTANEPAVWQRIVDGDAAFTHDTGNRLKAQLGSFVPVGAEGSQLRVGAYASNGIPPVADALISPATAATLGMQGRRDLLIAVTAGTDPNNLAQQIRRVANVNVEIIEQPESRRAYLAGADARNAFEPFNYIDMGDGMIQIDPDWVSRNIVRQAVPILKGGVVCHRLMVNQLAGALGEIEQRGLAKFIDPSQYGGCWVPRHIDFNPAMPLSMHGWGLAADINVSTNGLGMKPTMDPRVVAIFERWGFVWGGRWSRPDGMHFELGALVENSPQG